MNAKKIAMLLTIGACLLGLPAIGSLKNPVTRPWKSVIYQTLVITLDASGIPVSWEVDGVALSSHLGLSENRGGGTFDEGGNPVGTGVTIAANGDRIFWNGGLVTGGTGRFEGATGFAATVYMDTLFWPDPPPGTVVADVVLITEGTITY